MSYSGLIIVVIGVMIAIIGLRGTQKNVFPWFFGDSNSGGNPSPDKNNKCPSGYAYYNGICLREIQ